MATVGSKNPTLMHSVSSPDERSYFHPHPASSSWWHPWSTAMPPTHNSPFFNPRAYDTVAPWAYEHIPQYNPMSHVHSNFNTMSPLEREMWNAKHDLNNLLHNGHRHSFSSELNFHPARPGSLLEHYSLLNPVRADADGNRWLNCYFDLRSYKPEEINVTLNTAERTINVEAAHEVKESKEHYVKRSYSRKVYLPQDLKIDLSKLDIKSCLTNEGLLCVEAVLPKLTLEEARAANKFMVVHPTDVYHIPVKTA